MDGLVRNLQFLSSGEIPGLISERSEAEINQKKTKEYSKLMMFTQSASFTPSATPFVPSATPEFASLGSFKEFQPFTPSMDAPYAASGSFAPF